MLRIAVLLLLSLLPSLSIAQAAMDTLILVSNRKIICKVQSVSSSKVTILKKGAQAPEEFSRKQIHKIKYANGRVEQFNSLAFQMVDEKNFQAVVVTENPADVDGLYVYGKIEAKSGTSSKTAKAAEKNARIRLQRRAAAMGAMYVLITKSESRGGYKEVPTHYYEGIAYGIEPPKEGQGQ